MDYLLLIIARTLQLILCPVLLVWGFCRAAHKKELGKWNRDLAIAIDRFGNCMGKYTFNDLLGDEFGNSKETISSRLGKCEQNNKLKRIGPSVKVILNYLDENHCINSIDNII